MIKAIESNLYKIIKSDNYDDEVFEIIIKDTGSSIHVFKTEMPELINLLNKSLEIID